MNEEKITQLGKWLIQQITDRTDFQLPSFVQKKETKDGRILFLLTIHSEEGRAVIWYDPLNAVKTIIKLHSDLPIGISTILHFLVITDQLLRNFPFEFSEVLASQPYLASYSSALQVSSKLNETVRNRKSKKSITPTKATRIVKIFGEGRKQRLLADNERFQEQVKIPESLFALLYEIRLELWKEAKKIYVGVADSKTQLNDIKTKFPMLDENLVDWFDEANIPNSISDSDYYPSTPRFLALIETARLLQMPEAKKARRTLEGLLRKSRFYVKFADQEKLEKEYFLLIKTNFAKESQLKKIIKSIKRSALQ